MVGVFACGSFRKSRFAFRGIRILGGSPIAGSIYMVPVILYSCIRLYRVTARQRGFRTATTSRFIFEKAERVYARRKPRRSARSLTRTFGRRARERLCSGTRRHLVYIPRRQVATLMSTGLVRTLNDVPSIAGFDRLLYHIFQLVFVWNLFCRRHHLLDMSVYPSTGKKIKI